MIRKGLFMMKDHTGLSFADQFYALVEQVRLR